MKPIEIHLKNPIQATVSLILKKGLAGDLIVYDHPEVNIFFNPGKSKITILPKERYSDHVFNVQKRYLDFLAAKGVLEPKSIKSGSAFYSLEGDFLKPQDNSVSTSDVFLYLTAKFLKSEESYYNIVEYYDSEIDKMFSEPENTTELGEIPHVIDQTIDQFSKYGKSRYLMMM